MVKLLDCWPSLDALKEIEYVRRGGKTNMLDTQTVMWHLNEFDGYHGMAWIMQCKEHRHDPAWVYERFMPQIIRAYGPINEILVEEDELRYRRASLRKKRRRLETELAQLAIDEEEELEETR